VNQATAEVEQNVIFIPTETSHSFYSKASNQFIVFDAPASFIPRGMGQSTRLYPLDRRWQAVKALLLEEVGDEPATSQRLTDLFRYISGLLNEEKCSPSFDYIRNNFDKPITVPQLAKMEHFNPTYFVEWFKRKFGTSPISYIRELRLGRAQELLVSSDYSIMQIACQIGYENQSTLTRLFQKELGITPREYREKYRK
jgi:AraC-like DNA-binding protein